MASLLAARRENFAAAGGLHARAEPVGFGAPAFPRLISALWQSNPPLWMRAASEAVQPQVLCAHEQPTGHFGERSRIQ